MCGIVGYIGRKNALPYLLEGLQKLEYRGYDSAGVALWEAGQFKVIKKQGRVDNLIASTKDINSCSHIGIGHTRWATHGVPSDANAHPHLSQSGLFSIVHNGIIENYLQLKEMLLAHGYTFRSDTDTEVLVNYIEFIYLKNKGKDLKHVLLQVFRDVVGAYCIVLLYKDAANTLYAAKKGSPLVIGLGEDGYYLASDATPLIGHAPKVIYVEDAQLVEIKEEAIHFYDFNAAHINPKVKPLESALSAVEKNGFDHFMLKEIFEQPVTIRDCLRGRIDLNSNTVKLGGIEEYADAFKSTGRIIFIGCGTSWHAGLYGEYIIEQLCGIPVEVEYASEFRYRDPVINKGDIVVAISQSGETADTIVALQIAKEKGAIVIGIVNVVGSSIARLTEAGIYTHVGTEIGVASTKAFTGQLSVVFLLALYIAQIKRTVPKDAFALMLRELDNIPNYALTVLESKSIIEKIAAKYVNSSDAIFIGRNVNYPIALEGALKLKEISYIHAEGYPAGELKHGPIALIEEHTPTFAIATKDASYEKITSNIHEIKARNGKVIALVNDVLDPAIQNVDDLIEIPAVHKFVAPIINVLPLQLLAYYIGVKKGFDVDKPRNLAKSVTVE